MPDLLDTIEQISIYLKSKSDIDERVNEVALFTPFVRDAYPKNNTELLSVRQWTFDSAVPQNRRFLLKIKKFLFKKIKSLIPLDRKTPEAKFKTVLAILLVQEELREFFFKEQEAFFQAVKLTAESLGYKDFVLPATEGSPRSLSKKLTRIRGKKRSLIEDLCELQLQMAALCEQERNEILFNLLNRVNRPPIRSVLEVLDKQALAPRSIELTTRFGKVEVKEVDQTGGRVAFSYASDCATSSIKTKQLPKKSVVNQRIATDVNDNKTLGSYCGELITSDRVMEQLIFLLGFKSDVYTVAPTLYNGEITHKTVLFTSLYSWTESTKIKEQYHAIWQLNHKIITGIDHQGKKKAFKLFLHHHNIPFNAACKYPAPQEICAHIEDYNEESLIALTFETFLLLQNETKAFSIDETLFTSIVEIEQKLRFIRSYKMAEESDANKDAFLNREKIRLEVVDQFRALKPLLLKALDQLEEKSTSIKALTALLSKKDEGHHALTHMDQYIYSSMLAKELGYLHNTNCAQSTDRSAGAVAADKGQHVFCKLTDHPYFPSGATEKEKQLFKVLYSLYLVFEEPEITAALSTGFIGEKFYRGVLAKNPETTRYLMPWIKKNPQIYLGLSHYR